MKSIVIPRLTFLAVLAAVLTLAAVPSPARKQHIEIAPDNAPRSVSPATRSTSSLEQVLGEWDFENPPGQGWTPADRTAQPGNFTHVDVFAPPYFPLSGSKSLWCGARAGDLCAYLVLPGYGNQWDQSFTSVALPTAGGDVQVAYGIRYDTESSYDFVNVEYQSLSGAWVMVDQFTGVGSTSSTSVIPDSAIGSTVRIRFRFTSDAYGSDEDGYYNSSGAYELDDLIVSDDFGTINSQNFEAEAVDAQTTVDGKWSATVAPAYGLHAALFSGSTVLQEDSTTTNTSNLWGFFNNSTYDYSCAGHPEQLVVPYSRTVDGVPLYLDNMIESPPIDITQDQNGSPVTGPISLTFDVYRDLKLDALVFYRFQVRSNVAGCWKPWKSNGTVYNGADKTWARSTYSLDSLIAPGATQIQVALGAVDMCSFWCGVYGTGTCHSHGPLFDNVKVSADLGASTSVVTNSNDSGAGSLRKAILDANASPDYSGIVFDIPGAGPHFIPALTALPPITQRVIIDGYTQTGASANTNGQWQADNAVIQVVLSGWPVVNDGLVIQANYCTIRGLAIQNFAGNGIYLEGTGNTVEGCFIGTDATGTVANGNAYGIQVSGNNAVIGGETPAARNVIAANTNQGIALGASGFTVMNNFIGTDATGAADLGSSYGVVVTASAGTIATNLISGNYRGIAIFGNISDENQILGNRIGTDVTGTTALGQANEGIYAAPASDANGTITIGSAVAPNIVAYNGGNGVYVYGGGTFMSPRAVITHNQIYSNNGGVVVQSANTSRAQAVATIERNSIHDNALLGIDLVPALGPFGVTANDPGDTDTGPNGLQNFPTVSGVSNLAGGGVTIQGNLASAATDSFAIECFASPACDGSGNGEGQLYVGRTTGLTDGSGNFNFTLDSPAGIPGGWYVTATATHLGDGTTSEFSGCSAPYVNTPFGTSVFVVPVDANTLQSPVQLTFGDVGVAGNTSIVTSDTGPPPPGSYSFGDDPTFYDVTTTASYSGSIEVCIHYDEADFGVAESLLKVLHYDGASWVDITTSIDTVANTLCGTTTSLSPFAVAQPAGPTGVDGPAPSQFALYPCMPNPFNPSTTIRYDVRENGTRVSIDVFDVTGRRVRSLVDGARPAGQQSVTWNGRDNGGNPVASGVYFYRMVAGSFTQTRKMVLLK